MVDLKRVYKALNQASRYLVKDFGTSKSPKSTRKRDSHCCQAVLRPCRSATTSFLATQHFLIQQIQLIGSFVNCRKLKAFFPTTIACAYSGESEH